VAVAVVVLLLAVLVELVAVVTAGAMQLVPMERFILAVAVAAVVGKSTLEVMAREEQLFLNTLTLLLQPLAVVLHRQPQVQAVDLRFQQLPPQAYQTQLVGHNGTLRIFR
jgi:hypothetical protein